MRFSDIKLPGTLVAGLYKKSLVELPAEKNKEPEIPAAVPAEKPQATGAAEHRQVSAEALPMKQEPAEMPAQVPPSPTPVPVEIQQPPAAKPPQPSAVPEEKISFLGNNQRNVLIMVSYPGETYLPEQQLLFLTRILKACNLEEKDIAIINLSKQQLTFSSLQVALKPAIILFFGITPAAIRLEELNALFSPEQKEGFTMAAYPALERMHEDKLLKSKLWLTLKQLFNV